MQKYKTTEFMTMINFVEREKDKTGGLIILMLSIVDMLQMCHESFKTQK